MDGESGIYTLSVCLPVLMASQDKSSPFNHLKERFYDTERMMLAYSDIISEYPTQVYYSVLPFLPSDTFLSCHYSGRISILTSREKSWSPLLFRLAKSFYCPLIFFTLDGCTLAVVSDDGIELYDASNGLLNNSIKMPEDKDQRTPLQGVTTADGSQVLVLFAERRYEGVYYGIQHYDLAKQSVQLHQIHWHLEKRIANDLIRLSGDGSYIVFAEPETSNTRICVQRIHGGDASVLMGCNDEVQDLALTSDSPHLVAVAAGNTITILDIPSSHVLQTLSHEDVHNVRFSPDGLFIASWSRTTEARLFSRTQGTLLATFEIGMRSLAFSRANRLYMLARSGNVRVYSAEGDHNQAAMRVISLRGGVDQILPAPNDSQIVIQTLANLLTTYDVEVWSLRRFTDNHDASTPHPNPLGIDLSGDASRLAIGTRMEIEVWDARVGQRCQVFQTQSQSNSSSDARPVAFSPQGELIATSGPDGVIVVDVQAGVLTSYLVEIDDLTVSSVGISFDSSRLAAKTWRYVLIWDLPSGALLHTVPCDFTFQWSRIDLCIWLDRCICLNTETLQEEILEYPGDRFREPNHLYDYGNELRIRSSSQRDDPLFLALPSRHTIQEFRCRGDRVCILNSEGRLLLLDISCLDEYMKKYCHLESKSKISCTQCRYNLNHPIP